MVVMIPGTTRSLSLLLIGVICAAHLGAALAGPSSALECRPIEDPQKRLACYDAWSKPDAPAQKAAAPPSQVKPAAPSQASHSDRLDLAKRYETALLGAGVDAQVFVIEQRSKDEVFPSAANRYPRLIFFGWFSRPGVYQMVTTARVLEGANAAGFHEVEFSSKGSDGNFYFDLTAGVPKCADRGRLCL